jgi:hypothetical protein
MAVIEYEKQMTRATLVLELLPDTDPDEAAKRALLASAAGAGSLTDEAGPTDAELIAAFDAHTRPLDASDLL